MTVAELEDQVARLKAENAALRQQLDRAEEIAGIKRGLQDFHQGRTKTLRQFDAEMRATHGIPK
jgi:hypothetical protein